MPRKRFAPTIRSLFFALPLWPVAKASVFIHPSVPCLTEVMLFKLQNLKLQKTQKIPTLCRKRFSFFPLLFRRVLLTFLSVFFVLPPKTDPHSAYFRMRRDSRAAYPRLSLITLDGRPFSSYFSIFEFMKNIG